MQGELKGGRELGETVRVVALMEQGADLAVNSNVGDRIDRSEREGKCRYRDDRVIVHCFKVHGLQEG